MHRALCMVMAATLASSALAQTRRPQPFVIRTHRMDVDVDGAPRAYGPAGFATLDVPQDAHSERREDAPIVGYMTEHGKPVVQGVGDPAPGYYVSQTSFEDDSLPEHDPHRYVDATKINYVVLGDEARRRGARIGDLVAVYSRRHHACAYGIVADAGNPSGDEGSLHLLQSLGYAFHDGRNESVEEPDIFVRFYPRSNREDVFFREQVKLDAFAKKRGISCDFSNVVASKKTRK